MLIPPEPLERAMSVFRVVDPDVNIVPFRLNGPQRRYHNNRTTFDIIYKSRQLGFSTYIELEFTIACARFNQLHAVVIAHDSTSTEKLFGRTKFFLEDMTRVGAEIPYKTYKQNEISFTTTGSTFYIGTAGSRKFGRGDTIHLLHCSEVAFWPNAPETMGGLIPAARRGRIVVESTANGRGNYFHRSCVTALQGMNLETEDSFTKHITRPRLHFYPYHEFDEYQIPGNYNVADTTKEERELMKKYHLSLPQIAWRRQTMLQMPRPELFPQEYPMTFDEGFLMSGHGYFPNCVFIPEPCVNRERGLKIWKQPQQSKTYLAGIDTGGGTRRDYSVVEILDAETLEQVAELAVNDESPKKFAKRALDLCHEYNIAFTTIEVQHGQIVLDLFKDEYRQSRLYVREKPDKKEFHEKLETYGVYAAHMSKLRICAKMRGALDGGAIVHSEFLKDQIDSFVETDDGKLQGEEGCHDDAVLAYAYAVEGLSQVVLPVTSKTVKRVNDTFTGYTFDAIRKRITRGNRRPKHL